MSPRRKKLLVSVTFLMDEEAHGEGRRRTREKRMTFSERIRRALDLYASIEKAQEEGYQPLLKKGSHEKPLRLF